MAGSDAGLYELLDKSATTDQLQNLLRDYKKGRPKEVLVSGTKSDVIEHLRNAVNLGAVPRDAVVRLLRGAEENGSQHIFFFSPRSRAVANRCNDPEEIAAGVWGHNWKAKTGFPRFIVPERQFEWADFRERGDDSKGKWVAKAYGRSVFTKLVKETKRQDGTIIRWFRPQVEPTLTLVRWLDEEDLLEVRVSRCDSRATLLFQLRQVWNGLSGAIEENEFVPWSLRRARRRMLEERRQNGAEYQTGSLQLVDSASGRAIFYTYDEDEAADSTEERRVAIDAYMRRGCTCDHVVAIWQPDGSGGCLAHELRTVIGARYDHEVVITTPTTQTTARAVDYLIDRLRHFNREEA